MDNQLQFCTVDEAVEEIDAGEHDENEKPPRDRDRGYERRAGLAGGAEKPRLTSTFRMQQLTQLP